jgi:outer membrane protein TolC
VGSLVQLDDWREREEPEEARLQRAVGRLERLLGRRPGRDAPEWLRTEVLAIQGCLALGFVGDAAERTERLVEQVEQRLGAG